MVMTFASVWARCRHECRLFYTALQFYTRIQIPHWVGADPVWLQPATRYFPLVGWLIAGATATVYILSVWLWPQSVAVLLSTACGIVLTGAFHEEDFAHMCDGVVNSARPERMLETVKGSRIGAYGAIGIGLMLTLKVLLLSNMPSHEVVLALLVAHPLSRLASCAVIWQLDDAREHGRTKPLAQAMSNREFSIAAMTGCLPFMAIGFAGMLSWWSIAGGLLTIALTTGWLAWNFRQRIGGSTGDCLGAIQQTAEVSCYLALLANLAG